MRTHAFTCRYPGRASSIGVPAWVRTDHLRVALAVLARAEDDPADAHLLNDVLWLATVCDTISCRRTDLSFVACVRPSFYEAANRASARLPVPGTIGAPYRFSGCGPIRMALAVAASFLVAPILSPREPWDRSGTAGAVMEARRLFDVWADTCLTADKPTPSPRSPSLGEPFSDSRSTVR